MSAENSFIEHMRAIATGPAARGLTDDAAVLKVGGEQIVLTHDMLVEGVHYLADDPPETVAWKLVAVNMSDLAAKGAMPLGVLLGFTLGGDDAWDTAFATGLKKALTRFGASLLGGDTVSLPTDAPRTLGLTAIGLAPATGAPDRAGAQPGDAIFMSGSVGDAGAGLAILRGQLEADGTTRDALIAAYRNPMPSLALGQALAPHVHAMSDISDGLLIDAQRMANASTCAIHLDMDKVALSPAYIATCGATREAVLSVATYGDDYQLLLAAPPQSEAAIMAAANKAGIPVTRVGYASEGSGLTLTWQGDTIPLPPRLGYQHGE
ncbi:MAG: thiamine-phosphate kinase [Sphingobium sp.]|nr:thiamine-phosphate kinase [Sphingobium sp.]MCP5399492.1 thiamine-phosphate kinase [Sphingomonas sp.]